MTRCLSLHGPRLVLSIRQSSSPVRPPSTIQNFSTFTLLPGSPDLLRTPDRSQYCPKQSPERWSAIFLLPCSNYLEPILLLLSVICYLCQFFQIFTDRQTDRQTDRETFSLKKSTIFPPFSPIAVTYACVSDCVFIIACVCAFQCLWSKCTYVLRMIFFLKRFWPLKTTGAKWQYCPYDDGDDDKHLVMMTIKSSPPSS